jgi:hypothetical protein
MFKEYVIMVSHKKNIRKQSTKLLIMLGGHRSHKRNSQSGMGYWANSVGQLFFLELIYLYFPPSFNLAVVVSVL